MTKWILVLILSFFGGSTSLESKNLVLAEDHDLSDSDPKVVEANIDQKPFDLWDRVRKDLTFTMPVEYEDAEIFRKRYVNNQHAVNRLSQSGQRYLFHTVKRAEELGIPVELALLPFVESEFDPYAQSVY